MIKGGGGALLMEKIIAYSSRSLVIVVDDTKLSPRLCERFAVPVEVVADAVAPVSRRLGEMGGEASLRMAMRKAGPVVTDLGNLLLDVRFRGAIRSPENGRRAEADPGRAGKRAVYEKEAACSSSGIRTEPFEIREL